MEIDEDLRSTCSCSNIGTGHLLGFELLLWKDIDDQEVFRGTYFGGWFLDHKVSISVVKVASFDTGVEIY